MHLPAISRRRHSVFGLPVCVTVRNHILKVCEHDILQLTCDIFTKLTTEVQFGTEDELIRFGGQEVKDHLF